MNEYLDTIEIKGLDETYAENMDVDEVGVPTVLLVDFCIDGSSSMEPYEQVMRDCLVHYRESIVNSKQADEMLVSNTVFASTIKTGGYVAPQDLNTDYSADGITRLYDTIVERRQRLLSYMDQLKNNGTNARACVVILSDGEDVGSSCTSTNARNAIKDLISREVIVAFIAFGPGAAGIADTLGIKAKNVKAVTNNESELREVIDLTSKSAQSASKRASAGVAGDGDNGFFDV